MRIDFREIPASGLDVSSLEEIQLSDARGADPFRELYRFKSPFQVNVHLDKTQENVFVSGRYKGEVEVQCVRCLKPLTLPVDEKFKLTLMPHSSIVEDEGGDESELEADDLDLAYYEAEELDVGKLVAEQVLLLLDLYPHCSADCKGLCPVCGANRNESECHCEQDVSDSKFAALKKFKTR